MIAEAIKTIGERNSTHGDFREQASLSQKLKEVLTTSKNWPFLEPEEKEALEMVCVKISRILTGNPHEPDHWLDISGYSELGRQAALRIKARENQPLLREGEL